MNPGKTLREANLWLMEGLEDVEATPLLSLAADKDTPTPSKQQAMSIPDDSELQQIDKDKGVKTQRQDWEIGEDGFPHLATANTTNEHCSDAKASIVMERSSPTKFTTNYSPQRPSSDRQSESDWIVGDLAEDGFPQLASTSDDSFNSKQRIGLHDREVNVPIPEASLENNQRTPITSRPPRHPSSSTSAPLVSSANKKDNEEEFVVSRKKTVVEREFQRRQSVAKEYIDQLPPDITVQQYLPTGLQGALFCGHLMTDLDSIAGSIGAAELYGGVAARASEINPETAFVLDLWGVEAPHPIEELLVEYPQAGVCLVDHQQMSQLNKAIDVSRIVGVIDHHALQNATIITEMPIYIDIRPWGSMSSIITHIFMTLRRRPRRETAGVMLCAILSDTLNLQSPTTTEWDRLMVAVLVQLAEIEDVQSLASQQFKAKSSELAGLSPEVLISGDQKVFTYKTADFDGSIAFAVVETTDDDVIICKKEALIEALREDKDEKGYSLTFLAIVNIVDLHSTLLLCGPNERSLAAQAFPDSRLIIESYKESDLMDLGRLVSRKKDFIPSVSQAIKKGWSNAPRGSIHASPSDIFDFAKYRDTSLTMSKVH